jgi:prepilin-type N-terminal cleavage/methylation domain-containing protein
MKTKAFSLVELLVSMAIIAILLGLAGFGIATAQRNQRNAQRRQAVANISLAITDYQTQYNKFPTKAQFSTQGDKIILSAPTGGTTFSEIPASGPAKPSTTGTTITNDSAYYCYDVTGNGYLLGVKLESAIGGTDLYHNASTDTTVNVDTSCASKPLF